MNAETQRLKEARDGKAEWKKWGPYLAERQWGTVRKDYSEGGRAWDYFTHDQARSRAILWTVQQAWLGTRQTREFIFQNALLVETQPSVRAANRNTAPCGCRSGRSARNGADNAPASCTR